MVVKVLLLFKRLTELMKAGLAGSYTVLESDGDLSTLICKFKF
jgi:hypothetical protein